MQKQKQLEELYAHQETINSKIQQLEHDIQKEKYRNEITTNANKVYDVVFHYDKEADEYYLAFYLGTGGMSRPLNFKLDKDQFHNLQTLIHTTLEESEMTDEERNAMNLMNHFFHINNFKPIRLNRGPN